VLTVGLLGGMGPAATVDFMGRLVRLTPADRDQQHLHILVDCDPSVPDRTAHILAGSRAPARHLVAMARRLTALDAELLVMVCNSAHAYYDDVAAAVDAPVVDWVDEVASDLARRGTSRVGVLATEGTLHGRLYERALGRRGIRAVAPTPEETRRLMEVIYRVKSFGPDAELALGMRASASALGQRGAEIALLACTELSLLSSSFPAAEGIAEIDAADVVARRVVARATRAADPT
jgi:aspartate racemase